MTEPIYISPSRLTAPCQVALYYEYVEKRKAPPSVQMLTGTAVHAAHAEALRRQARAGAHELRPDGVEQLVVDAFQAERARRGVRLDPDDDRTEDEACTDAQQTAVTFAQHAIEAVAPTVNVQDPKNVERAVELRIQGAGIIVRGVVDYIEPEGANGSAALWDMKVKKSAPSGPDVSGSIQLGFYAVAMAYKGEPVASIGYHWLRMARGGPEAVMAVTGAPRDPNTILRRVELLARVFELGLFQPVDPNSMVGKWACSAKFCPHFDYCPYGQARRVQVGIRKMEVPSER